MLWWFQMYITEGPLLILPIFMSTDGQFIKSAIAEFVFANKHPLVTIFTKESSRQIFENPIKKQVSPAGSILLHLGILIFHHFDMYLFLSQLLLFATSKDSENVLPQFQEAAKAFKGKVNLLFVECIMNIC